MEIEYKVNHPITVNQYITLVNKSALSEHRPTDNEATVKGMLENSNLIVTAWVDDQLVGIARSMTDFHYCCYLSDLAVDESVQSMGIDKYLILVTAESMVDGCKIVLLSDQKEGGYYSKMGFKEQNRAWVLTDISELVLP
ncbi:GCN5 family acetyltransferase [Photobacterium iliopiscarium]|jgi:poly-beta-hydroxyalkanoate depolymerase|uniref:N-acetyltransferase n=1 Tax=Photobacterium iliopiscarium TaxID=56192 RepID=A0A0D8PM54_9GAMM|nr:GNAT family N-acetyltransferase [Photobacterium iliopiscarium]KJG12291.1 GCN5 family acetyltransferase [Photobacterium iliopiscarium]KJG20041.1 GCN5 family acetyltransferase [Photobacterium iliopiscarium]PST96682.1 N-acetyltransferase [Photobacterium iliopiscarium]PSU00491.1 N-acetyltransferase [Photobacterium iliopiscarium]PSV83265.1 N-acetyltransferase [Photobacterium iliopiscarium]